MSNVNLLIEINERKSELSKELDVLTKKVSDLEDLRLSYIEKDCSTIDIDHMVAIANETIEDLTRRMKLYNDSLVSLYNAVPEEEYIEWGNTFVDDEPESNSIEVSEDVFIRDVIKNATVPSVNAIIYGKDDTFTLHYTGRRLHVKVMMTIHCVGETKTLDYIFGNDDVHYTLSKPVNDDWWSTLINLR